MKENKYHVSCLQETYCTKSFVKRFARPWSGKVYHSLTDSNHSRGVCVLISKNCSCKISDVECDKDGRKVIINIKVNNVDYNLVSIYCPSKNKLKK